VYTGADHGAQDLPGDGEVPVAMLGMGGGAGHRAIMSWSATTHHRFSAVLLTV
jgi:hypothetical protein